MATPHLISLQGYATDSSDVPLVTGNVAVRIYNVDSGGSPVYDSGTDYNGAISNGIFDVLLGSITPLDLDNTVKYYMEIDINGQTVDLDPSSGSVRQQFYPGGGSHTHTHVAEDITGGDLSVNKITAKRYYTENILMMGNPYPRIPRSNIITTVDTASIGYAGLYTSIAIGTDGYPVISYYTSWPNYDLKVLKCDNQACSDSNTITTVDDTGNVGQYASIAIGIDGLPVISYLDVTNYDLKVLKCDNQACSDSNTITTVDSTGDVGQYTSIAIGIDGLPVISYYDMTNGNLKVVKCGNQACSSGNTINAVDSTGDVGDYTSIAIGIDGLPVISYHDETNYYLKVVKCGNQACSSGNTITNLDTAADAGRYTSITIGADGLPVISYHHLSYEDLKVVKCGNQACSSGNTITNLDSIGYVGRYTSITIGADGLPVISYYDESNGNLKVVKCGNQACSSGNTINAVDSTGDVGQYTSIAIGIDGLPVISYLDVTNLDLKVVKCASPMCLNYWTRR
jgi:hypothetical protein